MFTAEFRRDLGDVQEAVTAVRAASIVESVAFAHLGTSSLTLRSELQDAHLAEVDAIQTLVARMELMKRRYPDAFS